MILVSLWKELERFIGKFPGTAKKYLTAELFLRIFSLEYPSAACCRFKGREGNLVAFAFF